jgi:hypothetical protein
VNSSVSSGRTFVDSVVAMFSAESAFGDPPFSSAFGNHHNLVLTEHPAF